MNAKRPGVLFHMAFDVCSSGECDVQAVCQLLILCNLITNFVYLMQVVFHGRPAQLPCEHKVAHVYGTVLLMSLVFGIYLKAGVFDELLKGLVK